MNIPYIINPKIINVEMNVWMNVWMNEWMNEWQMFLAYNFFN